MKNLTRKGIDGAAQPAPDRMDNMEKQKEGRVAVIGGGAAGLLAAGRLAQRSRRVALIEKNPMLGKKLRITGKGRCNVTNACEVEDMLRHVPANARFLYSAFYSFTNDDLIALLREYGVETKVERGGRVFPVSDKAKDVVEGLKRFALQSQNVRVMKKEVKELILRDGAVRGVRFGDGSTLACRSVVVATGGLSYPLTGSTGDGYKFARQAGHSIVPCRPSLVPLVTRQRWVSELMGLGLKNIALTVTDEQNKHVYEDFGELLFTHFGVSGPVVLSASAHMRDMERKQYRLHIDLKPALSAQQLDERIRRDFTQNTNKHLINALDALLPKALIPVILRLAELDEHKVVNQISKEERLRLGETLKDVRLDVAGFRPIEEAIITSGGVNVKEINPSTMESKLVSGLFFAGEVLDVDAYTGGFNLQIAFSTGWLAGDHA